MARLRLEARETALVRFGHQLLTELCADTTRKSDIAAGALARVQAREQAREERWATCALQHWWRGVLSRAAAARARAGARCAMLEAEAARRQVEREERVRRRLLEATARWAVAVRGRLGVHAATQAAARAAEAAYGAAWQAHAACEHACELLAAHGCAVMRPSGPEQQGDSAALQAGETAQTARGVHEQLLSYSEGPAVCAAVAAGPAAVQSEEGEVAAACEKRLVASAVRFQRMWRSMKSCQQWARVRAARAAGVSVCP